MRDAYLMPPSVTRNPEDVIKAIGRRRRARLLKTWGPVVLGVAVFALLIGFLLSDTGHNWMVWVDGGMQ